MEQQDLCLMFLIQKAVIITKILRNFYFRGAAGILCLLIVGLNHHLFSSENAFRGKPRKAKETIANLGFESINDVPPEYKYNNAKGAENRKTVGKLLHLDHSPGNVKVLHLIRDKCREFNPDTDNYDMIIRTLKEYFKTIQTLDWITIEQDDIRTYKTDSDGPSKKEKDMMSHEERDNLLNDIWEDL